jgi:hypothetical protein
LAHGLSDKPAADNSGTYCKSHSGRRAGEGKGHVDNVRCSGADHTRWLIYTAATRLWYQGIPPRAAATAHCAAQLIVAIHLFVAVWLSCHLLLHPQFFSHVLAARPRCYPFLLRMYSMRGTWNARPPSLFGGTGEGESSPHRQPCFDPRRRPAARRCTESNAALHAPGRKSAPPSAGPCAAPPPTPLHNFEATLAARQCAPEPPPLWPRPQ